MKKILIIFETINPKIIGELQQVGHEINDSFESYGFCINADANADELGLHYLIKNENNFEIYDTLNIVDYLDYLHSKFNFDAILVEASYYGRMIAPSLAMKLDVGLVADVTSIDHIDEKVVMIRPAFDGKLFAGIVSENNNPIMMSVRRGVFKAIDNSMIETKVINENYIFKRKSKIVKIKTETKSQTQDIRECQVVVAGGNGTSRYFEKLDGLASNLNGMVGASRKIIDQNIAPRSIQVGQSGKIISPKLYIAIGIYGSLQHIEGLNDVKYIIAVNTNKNAPICSLANIVVVGNGEDFIDKLIKKIKK